MTALGSTLLQGGPEHDAVPAASAGLGGLGCPTTGARDRRKKLKRVRNPFDHYHNDILVGLDLLFYFFHFLSLFIII